MVKKFQLRVRFPSSFSGSSEVFGDNSFKMEHYVLATISERSLNGKRYWENDQVACNAFVLLYFQSSGQSRFKEAIFQASCIRKDEKLERGLVSEADWLGFEDGWNIMMIIIFATRIVYA